MIKSDKQVAFLYLMLIFGMLIGILVYYMIQDPEPVIRFCGYSIGIVATFIGLWLVLYFYFELNLLSMF